MFNGPAFDSGFDGARLMYQHVRIYSLMKDGDWRTFREIAAVTGDPEASISAQLRHLRKERFGSHTVNRRLRGEREGGLYEYQLVPNVAYELADAVGALLEAAHA
jgi:hypothetical protein